MKKSFPFIVPIILLTGMLITSCQKQTDFSPQISTLQSQVSALQKRCDSLSAALASSNSTVLNLSAEVLTLTSNQNGQKLSLDSIRTQIAGILTAIATLNTQVSQADAQITSLNTQLTQTNANVSSINAQITAIDAQITTLNNEYTGLLNQLNQILAELNTPSSLSNGLVAYYPFSGNANDVSGNNKNATVYSATLTTDRLGNSNSAYLFDGVSSYISTPIIETGYSSISVACWFKTTNGGQIYEGSRVANTYPNTLYGTRMDIIIANKTGLFFGADGDGYVEGKNTNNNNFNDNNWHHVVGVWQGTGFSFLDTTQFSIYVDGILVPQSSLSSVGNGGLGGNLSIPINGTNNLLIGKWRGGLNANFSGSIDEFRYYNRALTQTEITYLATH